MIFQWQIIDVWAKKSPHISKSVGNNLAQANINIGKEFKKIITWVRETSLAKK